MNSFTTGGKTYNVGDTILVLSGDDKGRTGKIHKFYYSDSIVSVSVKYGEAEYSMYQISDIELI